ncbi:MAG: FecR domain-containing protein [Bacteroidota bacterium]
MTRDEYLLLFDKYLAGKATPQEIATLMQHRDDFELSDTSGSVLTEEDRAAGKRIISNINQSTGHGQVRKMYRSVRWYAAAAILVTFTAGLLVWKSYRDSKNMQPINARAMKNDVAPGTNKAILTLANGKKIILTDATNGTLAKQGNVIVSKEKNGVLKYVVSTQAKGDDATAEPGFNTFTTPRGAEYHVVLPDGTMVWLNAASSIKFPTTFAGNERRVELTGEAYFEVAKDKHKPFKVKFNDQEVEVLGTHFDIMAYADEAEAKTTLLEGSVKISRNNIQQILKPGQQAVGTAASKGLQVQQVNTQEVMAWKNGFFLFRNAGIASIMRQAARWYDVDVVYEDDMAGKEYGGRVSRYKNISELLHNMELTGTIHFKIDGRRVTVMQ